MALPPAVGFSYMFPWYTIWCFLACIGLLMAVPPHIRARNTATLCLFAWCFVGNAIMFTNTIIWKDSLKNPSKTYCDIATKILAMFGHAVVLCGLAINIRLWRISRVSAVLISKKDKRNMFWLDLFLCMILPFIFGALHYIVQGHRYDIFEDIGCLASTYNVTLAYPLYFMWPVIISLTSAIFASMAIRQFLKRRDAFAAHLMSNNSGETKARYFRLIALSSTEILFALPLGAYKLAIDTTKYPVYPWVSWEDTKWGFSRVDFFPRRAQDRFPKPLVTVVWCGVPLSATFFFIWFGLCSESIEMYKTFFFWCLKPFGVKRPPPGTPTFFDKLFRRQPRAPITTTTGSLPTFNHTASGTHPSHGLQLDMDKIDFLATSPSGKAEQSTSASSSDGRSSYSASISLDEKDYMKDLERQESRQSQPPPPLASTDHLPPPLDEKKAP